MALVSITLYPLRDQLTTVLLITCHGARHGEYGDLWSVRREIPTLAQDSTEALQMVMEGLRGVLGP